MKGTRMCDKELLVAYVYDEMSAADRMRIETHLRECAECRDEIKGLRGARVQLAAWTPPELDVDFQIVRHTRGRPQRWWSPAWGLAAAATILLAAAAAIANVQVRYDRDGVTVRTGWARDAAVASAPAAVQPLSASNTPMDAQYAAIDRRLRQLESAPARPTPAAAVTTAGLSDAEILRRVRLLLAQSESRQRSELAVRVAQIMTDVSRQRQADLVQIANNLGRLEGLATRDRVQHQQVMDAVARLAQQR
ncbi:MAG: hypothetical protein DMF86_18030 [Acidobacteria bacterium]|nr:MAG: hypothetical protein DMF86_18030 [Acidobacteriota bacterium]